MGYTLLTDYDQQKCADKCTKINGCQAFNIYYERDPLKNPDSDDCKNPGSTTNIKVNIIPTSFFESVLIFKSVCSGQALSPRTTPTMLANGATSSRS